jgi:hypothetical protein
VSEDPDHPVCVGEPTLLVYVRTICIPPVPYAPPPPACVRPPGDPRPGPFPPFLTEGRSPDAPLAITAVNGVELAMTAIFDQVLSLGHGSASVILVHGVQEVPAGEGAR